MLAIQSGNAVSWVHQEPFSKGQRITNASGTVTSTLELDPWGGDTSRSVNQAFQPHKFTTYERDANGGNEAMMRRCQGIQRRFAQPDPYNGSYSLADPQSFNRYAYVQNDPVNFVDPTGLDPAINIGDLGTVTVTGYPGDVSDGGGPGGHSHDLTVSTIGEEPGGGPQNSTPSQQDDSCAHLLPVNIPNGVSVDAKIATARAAYDSFSLKGGSEPGAAAARASMLNYNRIEWFNSMVQD
jgi:RHS repeat-associated protein